MTADPLAPAAPFQPPGWKCPNCGSLEHDFTREKRTMAEVRLCLKLRSAA